jgi:hypothetical protein
VADRYDVEIRHGVAGALVLSLFWDAPTGRRDQRVAGYVLSRVAMTAPHRVFDAIASYAESGRFLVGSGPRATLAPPARAEHAEIRDRRIVALLSLLVRGVRLRSAVVATSVDGAPRVVAWADPARAMADASEERHVLSINDRDGSFAGALQLESAGALSHDELAFARAVAGDLGRAVGVAGEARSQRALLESIEVSDEATRLAALVSPLAEVCVVDRSDARIVAVRGVSSLVDRARLVGLVERIAGGSDAGQGEARSLRLEGAAMVPGDRALVAQLGLHSILHLPDRSSENGRSTGARVVMLAGADDLPFDSTLLGRVRAWAFGGDEDDQLHREAIASVRYRARELAVVSHQRASREGPFVALIEPASVAALGTARLQLEALRGAALRLSQLL